MNKNTRGLVISWFYPPGNSSEGLVTYKLLKNSKYTYDVFTRGIQNETIWDRKVNETKLVSDNVTVIKSKAKRSKEWINEAVEYFEQNADKYDFIMSRVLGVEAHEAALRIKNIKPDIKWIASFGDPLSNSPYIPVRKKEDNPFQLQRYIEKENPTTLKKMKLAVSPTRIANQYVWYKKGQEINKEPNRLSAINDDTFRLADILIFNNKYQYERAFTPELMQYKDKGVIVNHSFDLDLYPKKDNKESSKIRFCYVGHLDDKRNAMSVLKALGSIKKHDQKLSERVVFDFYGHMGDKDKASIISNDLIDVVSIHDDIGYLDSLEEISKSDWLLLIDANLNKELDEYIYFPAKLADYLAVKKNILAVTQLEGATADIMRSVRCGQIVTHSADEISIYLSKIIYQGYSPAAYVQKEWEKYDARNVAKAYDEVVKKLLERP